MTWSYGGSTGASLSDVHLVRRYIGDTSSGSALLQDEEIQAALDIEGSVPFSSALCLEWLSNQYAGQADKSVGSLSISLSQKSKAYADRAKALRARGAIYSLPFAGGTSISDKDEREADTDRVKPAFTVTMLDNPDVSLSDEESS